ncbi:hypothetical protein F53441_12606 [Fusarium austroafricanum]|uniref:Uncharacterized protein n=1 Tax=Fusarium austroafricanum TaxID=2364996 RepID=A0A8H4JUL6_9HYPO|nr:hypothetical protein F53441_12606 [Fusarium austroafricanum]
MSSNTRTNSSDTAHAQLFVVVNLLSPTIRKPWTFVIFDHATDQWQTYEIRKRQALSHPEILTSNVYPGIDGIGVRYFELASIPTSWVSEVTALVDTVPAPELLKELDCNHSYIRNILIALMEGGIIGESQAYELCVKVDSTDISRMFGTSRRYLY